MVPSSSADVTRALRALFTKGTETEWQEMLSNYSSRKHPRIERVTAAEGLGTMSKNNFRGINLGIRSILRIHSLTSFSLRPNMYIARQFS